MDDGESDVDVVVNIAAKFFHGVFDEIKLLIFVDENHFLAFFQQGGNVFVGFDVADFFPHVKLISFGNIDGDDVIFAAVKVVHRLQSGDNRDFMLHTLTAEKHTDFDFHLQSSPFLQ